MGSYAQNEEDKQELQAAVDDTLNRISAIVGFNAHLEQNSRHTSFPSLESAYRAVESKFSIHATQPYTPYFACFTLTEMPGCCGVLISHGSYICPDYRGKGIGTILNQFRQTIAKCLGYSVLICTDISTNTAQKAVLRKNGWQDIYHFTNKKTGNAIDISVKQIEHKPRVGEFGGLVDRMSAGLMIDLLKENRTGTVVKPFHNYDGRFGVLTIMPGQPHSSVPTQDWIMDKNCCGFDGVKLIEPYKDDK